MSLLTPLALFLLALIPPIIALYLLKLRRQDQPVSSIYLWQRFVRDIEANAPWQKLRRNLLLLLQILFMLLVILALARPATPTEGAIGQTVVLILDTSASMAATDIDNGSASRLEAAQTLARDLVTNLPDGARVTVITAAGGEAELLTSASQDWRQILAAITAAEPTALGSDLSPALALAEAIVAREPQAEIILLSDGAAQIPPHLSAPLRFIPVGQAAANQAISALSVSPEGILFVQVTNYGQQAVQRRLVLQANGAPFTAFDLDLSPGGHVERVVDTLPPEADIIETYLTSAETDFLALDDRAWAVQRTTGPTQVTLVTRGNFFLQTALSLLNSQALGKNVTLTVQSVEDWQAGELEENHPSSDQLTGTSSFHIFDTYVPDHLPPGNLLFIAPPVSVSNLLVVIGQASNPVPQPASTDHPLLQNVRLADTQILTSTVVSATTWARVVTAGKTPQGRSIPLLLAGEVEGRRVAVLTFSLQQSDLPLRPAFPILMANLVDYLAPGGSGLVPASFAPGESLTGGKGLFSGKGLSEGKGLTFSPSSGVTRLRLTGPNGYQDSFEIQEGRVSLPPLARPGLYQLTFEQDGLVLATPDTVQFAVNFLNPQESAIEPQPDLTFTSSLNREASPASLPPARREWWRVLAAGALVLLVGEWLVYRRSAVFRYGAAIWRWTKI
jgi:hypothetical protein